jgi:LAO/AO transport system kinase
VTDPLLQRYRQGDRRALARLVSLAARGEDLAEIARGLPPAAAPARVVAFTGAAGVGKSTLVGRLIGVARAAGHKVAVLACDPQSPLSGGALLGDRFRMGAAADDGVFIRSLAAVGGRGAVAEHLDVIIRLLEGFGFDVIFLETVGAGQGDVAVAELADVVVLLLQPESGDDIQWEKAGILELADVIAVHKADLPGAEQTAAQVRAALELAPRRSAVPVLRVSSKLGQGHQELWDAIAALPRRRRADPADAELLRLAQDLLARRMQGAEGRHDAELARLLGEWRQGACPPDEAAARLLRLLAGAEGDTIGGPCEPQAFA